MQCLLSTPKVGLEVILNVPPLDLYLQFEISRSYVRLRDALVGPLYPDGSFGHLAAARDIFLSAGVDLGARDDIKEIRVKNNFTVMKSTFRSGKVPREENRTQAFTDGSKLRDGSVGIGVLISTPEGAKEEYSSYLGSSATVFQAEISAITRAAEGFEELMASTPSLGNSLSIYSDSQAALSALHKEMVTSAVVKHCKESLNRIGGYASVRLRWVKGHADSEGNKRADELARRAAGCRRPRATGDTPTPKAHFDLALKDHLAQEWADRWKSSPAEFARQTKVWFPEPNPRKSRRILALGRATFSIIVRWLTGHAFLRMQNHRAGMSDTPTCRACGATEERADHVLLSCDAYHRERMECFLTTNIDPLEPTWEVDRVVKFLQRPRIADLEQEENPAEAGDRGQSSDDDW